MDDVSLLAAVSRGDDVALRKLFDRHAPWVAERLRRAMPANAVEDVVQETFIAVWHGSRRYAGQGDVAAWIWGIARRQAAMWMRSAGRPSIPLDEIGPVQAADAYKQAIQDLDLSQAFDVLGPEGEPARELVRMVYVEERRVDEIAKVLGIPAGTVKSRLFTARKRLRSALLGEET